MLWIAYVLQLQASMRFRPWQRLLIRSRWRLWLGPLICAIPYLGSIFWLLYFSQSWIAAVMLVPLLLIVILGLLTLILARLEFHGSLLR